VTLALVGLGWLFVNNTGFHKKIWVSHLNFGLGEKDTDAEGGFFINGGVGHGVSTGQDVSLTGPKEGPGDVFFLSGGLQNKGKKGN